MQEELQAFASGTRQVELKVIYSDMHGFWGGVTISIAGNGEAEMSKRVAQSEPQVTRGHVTIEKVKGLAQLLLDLQAWQQRVPHRVPVPDEVWATLRIRCGKTESSIWEWHRDLDDNRRLALIRDLMLKLAAAAATGKGSA